MLSSKCHVNNDIHIAVIIKIFNRVIAFKIMKYFDKDLIARQNSVFIFR